MNVLLLTSALPYPATSGGALRVLSLIRALHSLGHSVSLLTYGEPGTDWKSTPLVDLCRDVRVCEPPHRTLLQRIRSLVTGRPDIASRLASDDYTNSLHDMLKHDTFDLVQAEGIEMAWTLAIVRDAAPSLKRVFDTFNAEYRLQRVISGIDASEFRRWPMAAYSWVQSRRIARFEHAMMAQSDLVVAVSQEDADALTALGPDRPIAVVPSAIDPANYSNLTPAPNVFPNTIVFTGKMDYRPNVDAALWFTDDVLPAVRKRVPSARFMIVGQQPHSRLDRLREVDGVTVTGFVPEVGPYLAAAAVYVAPLRMGSGTRLKLLEAMAAGCAIVSTSTGAAGLTEEARSSMLIADDADELAKHIVGVLVEPERAASMRERAMSVVNKTYSWQAIAAPLANAYREAGIG
ncbi:MAG: glycosyltransferase [Chloroflexi bacterium]|nr:glycosyltransferase [Chloroflexota bacterium]